MTDFRELAISIDEDYTNSHKHFFTKRKKRQLVHKILYFSKHVTDRKSHFIFGRMTSNENVDIEALKTRIDEQGNLVRSIKSKPNSSKVCFWNSKVVYFMFKLFIQGGSTGCC